MNHHETFTLFKSMQYLLQVKNKRSIFPVFRVVGYSDNLLKCIEFQVTGHVGDSTPFPLYWNSRDVSLQQEPLEVLGWKGPVLRFYKNVRNSRQVVEELSTIDVTFGVYGSRQYNYLKNLGLKKLVNVFHLELMMLYHYDSDSSDSDSDSENDDTYLNDLPKTFGINTVLLEMAKTLKFENPLMDKKYMTESFKKLFAAL